MRALAAEVGAGLAVILGVALAACGGGGGGDGGATFTLTLATAGSGSGSLSPAAGTHMYGERATATITATAGSGSVFVGWSGAAAGTANPVTVTMDADKTITATFGAVGPVKAVTCHLPAAPNPDGPTMGWASWNTFAENINENTIKAQADAMVSSGMRDAGYQYVNVDAGYWLGERDATDHTIAVDGRMFPSGMAALADYIHGRGLKAGMYTDAGPKGCIDYYPTNNVGNTAADGTTIPGARVSANTGSYGSYDLDMRTFSQWGYDYVKIDWCGAWETSLHLVASTQYTALRASIDAAVQESGRPMRFSVCEWGSNSPWDWAPAISDLWRTSQDIIYFGEAPNMGRVLINFDSAKHPTAQSPGHYNDPDMLLVGVGRSGGTSGRFTKAQNQTHLALWAIMSAPLIAGNDLTTMDADTAAALTQRDMIAVDQDPLAKQATRVSSAANGTGRLEVYSKVLNETGCRAVVLLNRCPTTGVCTGTPAADIAVRWSDLGLTKGWAAIRDVWGGDAAAGRDLDMQSDGYAATAVPPNQAVFLVVQDEDAPTD
jgi:uncharacterized repeat protein (TIGR02543 family)